MAATKKTQPVELLNDLEPMLTRLKVTAIRDQLDTLLTRPARTPQPKPIDQQPGVTSGCRQGVSFHVA